MRIARASLAAAAVMSFCVALGFVGFGCATSAEPINASLDALNACTTDADCDSAFVCEKASGACICTADDACGAGSYCNTYGICQTKPPCLGNKDCDEGYICDGSSNRGGTCISADRCGSSVHCPFNQYCSPSTQQCTPGCRSTGDCQLGYVCQNNTCVDAASAEDCTLCPTRGDRDAAYCDYGELCTDSGSCVAHSSKPSLCQRCTAGGGCPDGLMCLVDSEEAGADYCTPLCDTTANCPSGYDACRGLIRVLQGQECTDTQTCSNGGECLRGSESNRGFCSCVSQADCNIYPPGLCMLGTCMALGGGFSSCTTDDDCICNGGKCLGSQNPCTTAEDCKASCVQSDRGNGRMVGRCVTNQKACVKEAGMRCDTLTTGASSCRLTDQAGS